MALMTQGEHKNILDKLIGMVSSEHQADASELFTKLSEGYAETFTTAETAANDLEAMKDRNEKLRKVNTDLFLKVGVTNEQNNIPNPSEPPKAGGDKKLTFEGLFNEKGELL